MSVWELVGYNTDSRYGDDVRHREYTTSRTKADLFERIPRIQFSDSGHGVEFAAVEHRGPRKSTRRMDYVAEQLALIRESDSAPLLAAEVARLSERVERSELQLRDAWVAELYRDDGPAIWIADAERKGQSVSEQLVRLEQLRTGAFS